jgi:glycogen synthase
MSLYGLLTHYAHAGLPVYFIEPHHPDKFFWRGDFYGERDDFRRFSYFSRVALEFLLQAGKKPDIIHCHDWQTAFIVGPIKLFLPNFCSLSNLLTKHCCAIMPGSSILGCICPKRIKFS